MNSALRAAGISVAFGNARALEGVDVTLASGAVRGLLGPNGAGKTTLLRTLLGLTIPDAGTVELLGRPSARGEPPLLHGVAGFVEDPRFYPYLTARANLEILALLDGDVSGPRIDTVLEQAGLRDRAEDRVGGYSTGMRQRLGIAAALLRAPELLLLDEPTSGLDPAGARDVATLVRTLADGGVAVLVSSHQIGELEDICDAYTIINRGRVVWDGTAHELRRQAPGGAYELTTTDDETAWRIAARNGAIELTTDAHGTMRLIGPQAAIDDLVVALGREGIAVRGLERTMSPLESIFFALTEQSPDALVTT